jgi:hypothetical protein
VPLSVTVYPTKQVSARKVGRRSGHRLNIDLKSATTIIPRSKKGQEHGIEEKGKAGKKNRDCMSETKEKMDEVVKRQDIQM